MFAYTDGTIDVTVVLLEDTHRSAHNAFNLINDVELDVFVAPKRAIDYIMNNERMTLPNGEVVNYGEYLVKLPTGEVNVYTEQKLNDEFKPKEIS